MNLANRNIWLGFPGANTIKLVQVVIVVKIRVTVLETRFHKRQSLSSYQRSWWGQSSWILFLQHHH